MEYLNRLKVDADGNWLEEALSCRKNNVGDLAAIQTKLESRYQLYDDEISNYTLEPCVTYLSDNDENALLKHYYEKPPSGLKTLLKQRRNDHELDACPYCGRPLDPDTLDHFMPKDIWPDYAIYPNNLIPQCRTCASKKGARYFCSDDNLCRYINPVFSNLLSGVSFIIETSFNLESRRIMFDIKAELPTILTEEERSRVSKHMRELEVKRNIKEYSQKQFLWLKRQCSKYAVNVELICNGKIQEAGDPNEAVGEWKTALYKGILNNQDVINYLSGICTSLVEFQEERVEVIF
jgi:hypothetical protein